MIDRAKSSNAGGGRDLRLLGSRGRRRETGPRIGKVDWDQETKKEREREGEGEKERVWWEDERGMWRV